MKRYWALKACIGTKESQHYLGRFSQGRRPRIGPRDKVILFEKKEGEIVFWANATVVDLLESASETEKREFEITIGEISPFEEPRTSTVLRFSLEKVYRFASPLRHFNRNYLKLEGYDYETIARQLVFWSRTALGLQVEALDTRSRFELAHRFLHKPRRERSHSAFAKELEDFVKEKHLSFARMAVATNQTASSLLARIGYEGGVGLVFPDQGFSPRPIQLDSMLRDSLEMLKLMDGEGPTPFEQMRNEDAESADPHRFPSIFPVTDAEIVSIFMVGR